MNEIQITNLDRDTKRFLAAKEVLGVLMLIEIPASAYREKTPLQVAAQTAVNFADALLEALEVKE